MGVAKVFIEEYSNRADYSVCFVDYDNRQKNEAIIAHGELVDYKNRADVSVYIEKYENRADILITRKNFPK